jgi:hypothetical protein
MVLTVHNLADAYKCLPSDILANATTFDLYVLDVHTKWVKYQHQEAENKRAVPLAPPRPVLSKEQMLNMIKRTRSEK